MSDQQIGAGHTVCVTGASGFIGSHLVQVLLDRGYTVRGTVRDPADEKKTAHLRAMAKGREERLSLHAADLMKEGSFDQAVAGCDLVCHVAAVVLVASDDPQRKIVDPAVKGTANVLGAVRRAGTVKRVALTSSIAAILDHTRPRDHVFTEEDWNEHCKIGTDPYLVAKTEAERTAWQIHRSLGDGERFEMVVLNPVFVFGPLFTRAHGKSSPAIVRNLLVRSIPACPRISFSSVDVRDVALGHALALEKPGASGRYILHNDALWYQEMARLIAPHFPDHRVPTGKLPGLLMYLNALVGKRVSFTWVRRNLGRKHLVDGGKSRRELGLEYRPLEQTLIDTCRSFVELGLANPKKG